MFFYPSASRHEDAVIHSVFYQVTMRNAWFWFWFWFWGYFDNAGPAHFLPWQLPMRGCWRCPVPNPFAASFSGTQVLSSQGKISEPVADVAYSQPGLFGSSLAQSIGAEFDSLLLGRFLYEPGTVLTHVFSVSHDCQCDLQAFKLRESTMKRQSFEYIHPVHSPSLAPPFNNDSQLSDAPFRGPRRGAPPSKTDTRSHSIP